MIDMKEKFFTPEQVAETLQVATETILRLIREKKIKATKVGGQWRIKESMLEKFLEEQSNIQDQ